MLSPEIGCPARSCNARVMLWVNLNLSLHIRFCDYSTTNNLKTLSDHIRLQIWLQHFQPTPQVLVTLIPVKAVEFKLAILLRWCHLFNSDLIVNYACIIPDSGCLASKGCHCFRRTYMCYLQMGHFVSILMPPTYDCLQTIYAVIYTCTCMPYVMSLEHN